MKQNELKNFLALSDLDLSSEHNSADAGLSKDEYERVTRLLNRAPNKVELGIIGAMWSEHCSYKSTKSHLTKLPTKGPQVLIGPGENAGAIDVGDDLALIFKIESHNHPSFIEPTQGAATGVGGILRDVFTMGARPFVCANLLRFGEKDHEKTKTLLDGVVRGIGQYGNCFGVPTVLSNVAFHKSYNGNNLVNAFAMGVAKKDEIFLGSAAGVSNRVLYVGAKTGRDGIMGAVMASDSFGDESEHMRPCVQVGDPFKEKLLLEACMQCFQEKLVIGIQDMGAAGMTSSSFEMATRASTGLVIDLDRVPTRAKNMSAYEIMLSESQERMLMVVEPKRVERIQEIFKNFELDCVDIGEVTGDGSVKIFHKKQCVANLAAELIVENAPRYRREYFSTVPKENFLLLKKRFQFNLEDDIKNTLDDLNHKHLGFITQQFDHDIGLNTLVGPNQADAALLKIPQSKKSVALSLLANEKQSFIDPFEGARRAVFNAALQVAALGAKPQAITNCLNFGAPTNPEVMTQLKHSIDGMAHAAVALETPIISGNVSLYNDTNGQAILPTLALSMVGVKDDQLVNGVFKNAKPNQILVLLGELPNDYSGSENCFKEIEKSGHLETWDEKTIGHLIAILMQANHDKIFESAAVVERGGLFSALMRLMSGANCGAKINFGSEWLANELHMGLFSEGTPRVLLSLKKDQLNHLINLCAQKIAVHKVGHMQDGPLQIFHNADLVLSFDEKKIIDHFDHGLENYAQDNS